MFVIQVIQDNHPFNSGDTQISTEIDEIIVQTVNAFQSQNFLSKEFLSKVPELHYNYLVNFIYL